MVEDEDDWELGCVASRRKGQLASPIASLRVTNIAFAKSNASVAFVMLLFVKQAAYERWQGALPVMRTIVVIKFHGLPDPTNEGPYIQC